MPQYSRVIPRDLFNEAKLLKCLGKLSLLIHDGYLDIDIKELSSEGFIINQSIDGDIYCVNLVFGHHNHELIFYTPLNARSPWPLMLLYKGGTYHVFNDKGEYQLGLFKRECDEKA